MEYLDLYDKNKRLTGEIVLRTHDKANIEKGKYINIVLVFIKNSDNKFLFQMTSKEKNSVIATAGGHVKSGQTSLEAILEEIKEEFGLVIGEDDIELIGTYKRKFAFVDVYYLCKDINSNELCLQKEEVESVNWYTINEIEKLIKQGKIRKGNIDGFNMVLKHLEICA